MSRITIRVLTRLRRKHRVLGGEQRDGWGDAHAQQGRGGGTDFRCSPASRVTHIGVAGDGVPKRDGKRKTPFCRRRAAHAVQIVGLSRHAGEATFGLLAASGPRTAHQRFARRWSWRLIFELYGSPPTWCTLRGYQAAHPEPLQSTRCAFPDLQTQRGQGAPNHAAQYRACPARPEMPLVVPLLTGACVCVAEKSRCCCGRRRECWWRLV